MGREAQDVKCTDDTERNDNTVKYYKNRHELYEDIKNTASKQKQERERERKRELEEN